MRRWRASANVLAVLALTTWPAARAGAGAPCGDGTRRARVDAVTQRHLRLRERLRGCRPERRWTDIRRRRAGGRARRAFGPEPDPKPAAWRRAAPRRPTRRPANRPRRPRRLLGDEQTGDGDAESNRRGVDHTDALAVDSQCNPVSDWHVADADGRADRSPRHAHADCDPDRDRLADGDSQPDRAPTSATPTHAHAHGDSHQYRRDAGAYPDRIATVPRTTGTRTVTPTRTGSSTRTGSPTRTPSVTRTVPVSATRDATRPP